MDANELAAQQLYKLQGELKNKKVLVVDRHPDARNAMRMMLSTIGITSVQGVGSATEVLRLVKSSSYDIILSDYQLEDGRDGQQLLEELRYKRLISLSTLFMVVTGERAYKNVVSVAELAPDDYLIKPFTGEQLQQRLARALYKKFVFHQAYRNVERSRYEDAVTACDDIIQQYPQYQHDARHLQADLLNSLGRFAEAEAAYRQMLEQKDLAWARMGVAVAVHGQGRVDEAITQLEALVQDFPEYLAAFDFLAKLREEKGDSAGAQQALQAAAAISPNNTLRQRAVGDMAVRNNDLEAAERAYNTVLSRARGSSLRSIDDYANLSRVMLEKGNVAGAKLVAQDLRRDWRGDKQGELASLVIDSLVQTKEGAPDKAARSVAAAMELHKVLVAEGKMEEKRPLSQKVAVDLAHACMANGKEADAQSLLRQVAAENNEDRGVLAHIQGVFEKTGNAEAGKALLEDVSREIIQINNQGVLAARSGDFDGSVQLLIEAAERVPNLQFLVNAAKSIYTLMDQKGWQPELAERAHRYLEKARSRSPDDPRVISGRDMYQRVARKYGVQVDTDS